MENMVVINYPAVLVAAIVSMVLGYIWFGPLFGKPWMELDGMTMDKMSAAKGVGMTMSYVIMFIGALLMAFVLDHALIFAGAYLKMEGVGAGLMSGFWNWLGFVAPVTIGTVLWDKKPWLLWVLTSGYYLVTLLVMGVVLAVWK